MKFINQLYKSLNINHYIIIRYKSFINQNFFIIITFITTENIVF